MMSVTIKGVPTEIRRTAGGQFGIAELSGARQLTNKLRWINRWTNPMDAFLGDERMAVFDELEAAEAFLAQHADAPSAKEGSEILGSGGAGRAALAEMRQQAVTINSPLADLLFTKCGLKQEQAVRVAEVVLGEGCIQSFDCNAGDHSDACPSSSSTEPAEGQELRDAPAEPGRELRDLGFDSTENYALTGEAMRVAAVAARQHEDDLWADAHLIAHGKDSRTGDGRTLVTATHVMDAIAHKAAPASGAELTALREQLAEVERERDRLRRAAYDWRFALRETVSQNEIELTARDDEVRRLTDALDKYRKALDFALSQCDGKHWREHSEEVVAALESDASPPPPHTIVGDGKPLPSGVWMADGNSYWPEQDFQKGGSLSRHNIKYTYVGPVPAEEERK